MKKDEVIIKIITRLDSMYGDIVNQQDVRMILEESLYDYEVKLKETALVPLNNIQDRIMFFLASKKIEGVSPLTIKSYGRSLLHFSNQMNKNIEDIDAMDIRIYLANYSKTGIKNSTLSTRTDILKSFFSWLETEEYISKNPMKKIKNIKVEESTREPLTPEEFEILTSGAITLRQKALLYTFASTGCRLAEVENMDIKDIDWNRLRLKVVGKGNKERIVYLDAKAKVHLQNYINSRDDSCEALFVTERKEINRLGRRAIQREINKIKEQSGLERDVFPHLLRHTYSTNLLSRGANIVSISKLLGHSSVSTTEIYAKATNENIEHDYRKYMWG